MIEVTVCDVQDSDTEDIVASSLLSRLTLSGRSQVLHHKITQVVLWKGPRDEELAVSAKSQKKPRSSGNSHVNESPRKQILQPQSRLQMTAVPAYILIVAS